MQAPAHDQQADHRQDQGQQPEQAEGLDGVASRVPDKVGQQADCARPADAARGVPEDKRAPAHVGGPGQPGRPHAQAEQKAAEEDRLRPMAFEERFAHGQHLQALAVKAPGALQQPAAALTADQIADVVAEDRRAGRQRDHHLDLQLATACQQRRRYERGLARHRSAARLGHDQQDHHRIADVVSDFDQRGKDHRRARRGRCRPAAGALWVWLIAASF